ncbi:MAG: CheR family methyltransferase, partial [Myxococcota bacterium]
VKRNGGLAVVQDPEEAASDGMPRSAIATGLVDVVAPLAEIPAAVLRYRQTRPRLARQPGTAHDQARQRRLLRTITSLLRTQTGFEFGHFQTTVVVENVARRMQLLRLEDLGAYAAIVREQPQEARALSEDLLASVTSFFRDREVFEALEGSIIPKLLEAKVEAGSASEPVRLWSVGCATGEEAYSLAIVLTEAAARLDLPPWFRIFATDVQPKAIGHAREGRYLEGIEADVSPERLRRFFLEEPGGYRVRNELRDRVMFASLDLLRDPPFGRLDLILCRDLLTRFRIELHPAVLRVFHQSLLPNGLLVLGASEPLEPKEPFELVGAQAGIYRKQGAPRFPSALSWPIPVPREPDEPDEPDELPDARTLDALDTREELQTLNEELRTINEEYRARVQELGHRTADLQHLLAATDIATLVLDRELCILRFTARITALFNIQDTDRGRPLSDITHRMSDDRVLRSTPEVLEREVPVELEVWDDADHCYHTRVTPYRDVLDRLEGVVITFVDITKRRRAEETLRESEQRFRTVAELVPDLLWRSDATGSTTWCNQRWIEYTGQTEAQARGWGWMDVIHPDERTATRGTYEQVVAAGCRLQRECRIRGRDGAYHWFLLRMVPVRDEAGAVQQWFGAATDVHEQRSAMEALILAKESAERANRAKSDFLARMSHELRTPMNGVMGMAQLALMDELPAEAREHLSLAMQSAESLLRIIDDLLDLSRIEAGRIDVTNQPFDLPSCVADVLAPLAVSAKLKDVGLVHRVSPDVPAVVIGDQGRLRQVLTNLVGNAVKFTEKGEIEVSVDRAPADTGRARKPHVRVMFMVRDTGIGIPPENLDSVFDSFSPATRDTHLAYGGTGLGLSISKQLVELMGGRIWAQSQAGEGSRFFFTIDFGRPDDVADGLRRADSVPPPLLEPVEPVDPPAATPQRSLRVLIAEDHPIGQLMAERLVTRMGHEVTMAADGEQALRALSTRRFDVALMDVEMPNVTGDEVARRVRAGALPNCPPDMPIVALTAHVLDEYQQRFRDAGMDDFIPKPLDRRKLEEVFSRLGERVARS